MEGERRAMGRPLSSLCSIPTGSSDATCRGGAGGSLHGPGGLVTSVCFHTVDFVQLPVPIIQQLYHWDCGLACSKMVLR